MKSSGSCLKAVSYAPKAVGDAGSGLRCSVLPCARARCCRTASRRKAASRRAATAAEPSASPRGDSDAAIVAALGEARANATLYERAVGGGPASLPRTEPGTGIYDYRSRRDPLGAGERTDLLRRLNDALAQKYPGLLNADLVLSSLAIEKALVTSEGAATYS